MSARRGPLRSLVLLGELLAQPELESAQEQLVRVALAALELGPDSKPKQVAPGASLDVPLLR